MKLVFLLVTLALQSSFIFGSSGENRFSAALYDCLRPRPQILLETRAVEHPARSAQLHDRIPLYQSFPSPSGEGCVCGTMPGGHEIAEAQPVEDRSGSRRQALSNSIFERLVWREPSRAVRQTSTAQCHACSRSGDPAANHHYILESIVCRGQFGKSPMDGFHLKRASILSRPTSTNISLGMPAGLSASIGPGRFITNPKRSHRVIMLVMPSQ